MQLLFLAHDLLARDGELVRIQADRNHFDYPVLGYLEVLLASLLDVGQRWIQKFDLLSPRVVTQSARVTSQKRTAKVPNDCKRQLLRGMPSPWDTAKRRGWLPRDPLPTPP